MGMNQVAGKQSFRKPNPFERVFNQLFGLLIRLGIGLGHNYLLQVRGRKSGRLRSTPVNRLSTTEGRYLVSPRGDAQWVRNVRSSGELQLKKAWITRRYRVRELDDAEKPALLKAYLRRYWPTVRRYFDISARADLEQFARIAPAHPVFELRQIDDP